MKNTIAISFLLFSCLVLSQQKKDTIFFSKEYNNIINYIPKQLKVDKKSRPSNRIIQSEDLNTIISLHLLHTYKDELGLNLEDSEWLEHRIDQLAVALFLDGKKILLKSVGGYNGCPNGKTEKKGIKNHNITILKLCYTCTGNFYGSEFISIFKTRMEKLMNTE